MMQQNSIADNIKFFVKHGGMLSRLITINVAVWLVVMLVSTLGFLFRPPEAESAGGVPWIANYLAVPSNFELLLQRPWTIITYMFLHFDFLHLLFNMLWLYWFGKIFMQYLSSRQLLGTYIFGGLAGAIFYILSFNLFPAFSEVRSMSIALGASASVLAIVLAIAFYLPEYYINLFLIGRVKIRYIAIAVVLFDVLTLSSGNAGGHLAHIGGALWGFAYAYMIPKFDPTRIFGFVERMQVPERRKKTRFKTRRNPDRPLTDEEYNQQRVVRQKRLDEILDKISHSGYDSLTKEEKEILFSSSNKH